ncbi:alpha/beta hydrolase [Jannaschia sp. W003]|uniref:alpha/beta hydrolase n=1 Tax=Jannaschia sp. W003 TaxID=2867012 RepID=UPI0021A5884C|nr:alpha/beta hydrolase [Jannaschia sp. W003]UWQ21431.1 alpha/beta hydrolase [Jannaschia sp. W003]
MPLTAHRIETEPGVHVAAYEAGDGPPLVLLHGYPQSHRCWLPALPMLAAQHRCILVDLRGYGASDAPEDDAGHTVYSKRRMAGDLAAVLRYLDIKRADVAGHDRGARLAYRFALDHPAMVRRLAVLDVLPTVEFWDLWAAELAMKAYHWTFLAQPSPMPERMIAGAPELYLDHTLRSWTLDQDLRPFAPDALEAYRAQMADPARVAAMCADYRAGFHTDRMIDAADRERGRRIEAPTLFLWGERGFPASQPDPLSIWNRWTVELAGREMPSGHFAPEEAPAAVAAALLAHFAQG